MPAKIKQGRYIDGEGVQQDVVFIGAEKAIFDDEGNRLDEKLESRSKASGLTVEDTEGILGVPEANVNFQVLVDAVASKIMNELVTDSALTSKLADYVTKAMLSNSQVNDQNMVPTSALAYAMNQAITENADAITQLNSDLFPQIQEWIPKIYDYETYKYDLPAQTYFKIGSLYVIFIYFIDGIDISDISTMLQIRNKPCNWIIGGSCSFMAAEIGVHTIQASDVGIYFRPNVSNKLASSTGVFTALLFGLDEV